MRQSDLDRRLVALASLGGSLRRALYHCVTSRDGGVGRDEAAAAVGVSRALAAYHLDKLVEAGLLDTRFERRTGRRGPGAGRTAKLYVRSASPVEVALPARDYQLLAELLARAVEADPSGGAGAALDRAARALGAEVAAGHAGAAGSLLRDRGYEPYDDGGVIRLRNCPFGSLAQAHQELVCHANLAFVEGLLQPDPGSGLRAVLDPRPGRCCVALVRSRSAPPTRPARAPARG
jgi:predicted ArsR family transcriptional regulator